MGLHLGTQIGVRADPAGQNNLFHVVFVGRFHRSIDEHSDCHILEGTRHIVNADGLFFHFQRVNEIDDACLQAGIRNVVFSVGRSRDGQRIGMFPKLCVLVDWQASGIGEPENACDFVVAFAHRVVLGLADDLEIHVIPHDDEFRVSAGYDNAKKGELELAHVLVRVNMPCEVMDRDKGLVIEHCQGFCSLKPNVQASDEAGSARNGKGIDVLKREFGFFQRLREANGDVFRVKAGCDFRHDATEFFVNGNLGRDDVREQFSVFGDRDGRFVATRFNRQYPSHGKSTSACRWRPRHRNNNLFSLLRLRILSFGRRPWPFRWIPEPPRSGTQPVLLALRNP